MKLGISRKRAVFLLGSILILLMASLISENIYAVLCTLWMIILVIHFGMKGGLIFALTISTMILINYFTIPNYRSFFPIMGIITYLSMSIGIGLPVDLMKKEQKNRRISEERLRKITDNIQDVIIQMDKEGIISYVSPSCEKILGQPADYYIGKNFYGEMHPEDCQRTFKMIESAFPDKSLKLIQYRYREKNGSYIWLESLGQATRESKSGKADVVINCRDITERKKTEEKIIYLSYHDTLTGLYNRAYFEEVQAKLIKEKSLPVSIIIGDVNGLKLVNDVFGHQEGDNLLIKAANILKGICRKEDIAVRWGGDEFAVLMPGADESAAVQLINEINVRSEEANGEPVKISIALGCGTKKTEQEEMKNIIKEAEEKMYRHKLLESKSARSNIISSLEETLFERSFETKEHTTRMMEIAQSFGVKLGLSENELDELRLLAALHDIGKIAIKDSILGKPGKLTEDEWQEMRKHSEIGYRIALSSKELSGIADYILAHHERWDGKGYPQKLEKENIPKLSRIIAIIDSYDAMTNPRVYKPALSEEAAVSEIKNCSGTQFDPELAEAFIQMIEQPADIK